MKELASPESELKVVQLLWSECVTFGPEHGRKLLVETGLIPEDFTVPKYRKLFEELSADVQAGRVPLRHAFEDVVSQAQGETSASILRELSLRRQVAAIAQGVVREVQSKELDVAEIIALGEQQLRSVPLRESQWRPLAETNARVESHLEEIQEGKRWPSVPTGFADIDAETGGLPPTLVVIAAMPGVGKSAFEASVLRNMAMRGELAAVFCMEDRSEWLSFRFLAHESGVHQFVLRNRPLAHVQNERVRDALRAVEAIGKFILCDDRPMLTPAEVLLSARMAIRRGARAIFLDNMTAMRFQRGHRMDLEMQDFLTAARALADENGVPFVVLSHVRRREGLDVDQMPGLTDCSETSAFEKLSRVAYGLCRAKKSERLSVAVLKNTNGRAWSRFELALNPVSALVSADTEAPSPGPVHEAA